MGRWDDKTDINDIEKSLKEFHTVSRLELTDTYDQLLLELKRLHKEREKSPENKKKIYDIAIKKIVDYMYYIAHHANIPKGSVYDDLVSTEKGGKYRKLYPIDYDNVVSPEERKKKSAKAKTKRKPVKKIVKKCKCKK